MPVVFVVTKEYETESVLADFAFSTRAAAEAYIAQNKVSYFDFMIIELPVH